MRRISLCLLLAVTVAALVGSTAALAGPSATKLLSHVTVIAGKPSEFGFKVSPRTAKRGIIVFKIANQGQLPHTFKLCSGRNRPLVNSCTGRSTAQISPGQSATLRVTVLLKGSYEYLCTVPGHAAGGMKGILKVT